MSFKRLITSALNLFLFVFLFSSSAICQKIDKEIYRKDMKAANAFFDKNDFKNAAAAYQKGFDKQEGKAYTFHRFKAAVSFAEINNKKSTFFHLDKLVKEGDSSDIRDIRKNKAFTKFNELKEWKILDEEMSDKIKRLIAHHKNLKVFSHKKSFRYSALRITSKGDTVANTQILLSPDGTGWGDPSVKQTQILCHYSYTPQDSSDHIDELKEIVTEKFWLKTDSTGIIEDEKEVWMHPFRYNEFFKTEVAPFPVVHFPISNQNMIENNTKIYLMRNWGTYSPSVTKQQYFYAGKEKKNYDFKEGLDCHRFLAYGHNSVHGISHLEYFFHEEFGFTEMNYETYDQDIIQFKMIEIKERNN